MSILGLNLGRMTGDDAGGWDQGSGGNWSSLIGPAAAIGLGGYYAYDALGGAGMAGAASGTLLS